MFKLEAARLSFCATPHNEKTILFEILQTCAVKKYPTDLFISKIISTLAAANMNGVCIVSSVHSY